MNRKKNYHLFTEFTVYEQNVNDKFRTCQEIFEIALTPELNQKIMRLQSKESRKTKIEINI